MVSRISVVILSSLCLIFPRLTFSQEKRPLEFHAIANINWGDSPSMLQKKMLARNGVVQLPLDGYPAMQYTSDTLGGSEAMRFRFDPFKKKDGLSRSTSPKFIAFRGGTLAEEPVSSWQFYVGPNGMFGFMVTLKKKVFAMYELDYVADDYRHHYEDLRTIFREKYGPSEVDNCIQSSWTTQKKQLANLFYSTCFSSWNLAQTNGDKSLLSVQQSFASYDTTSTIVIRGENKRMIREEYQRVQQRKIKDF